LIFITIKLLKLENNNIFMDEVKKEEGQKANILEVGEYQIDGPENGDISFDKITLAASSGAKRIWKVKSFTPKEIILEVIKFG